MRKHVSLFFVIFLLFGVLFVVHWLLFVSIDMFFAWGLSTGAIVVLSAGFPLFFFVATGWVHRREHRLSRFFYLLATLWMGFFSFLFFSVFLTFGVFWIGVVSRFDVALNMVYGALAIASFVALVYGVWNALYPRVKHIEVDIVDLPAYWEGKKIVQLSDVHLGAIYGARHFRRIATMANAEKPEIIAMTGDTFDGMEGSIETFVEPLSRLKAVSGVFFIIGNHETYLGVDTAKTIARRAGLTVLDDEVTDIEGLKIVGLSYPPGRGKKKRFVERLAKMRSMYEGCPTLLLMHSPEKIKKIATMGISLQLSGHTHFGQITPYNIVTHIMHKGYDYGKFEIGNYTLYTTNGVGTWGPPIRFGNTPEVVVVTLRRRQEKGASL